MEENKVKARYDKSVDILYLLFKEGPSREVVGADPDCTSNSMRTEKSWE